ncbi:phosphatidylinositol 4-kinase beta 1-like protein isoform X1 [Tanacetum coccineum]
MVVRILGLTRGEDESPREITRNNLLSESGGESGWLIRFFDSAFFCEWIAVSYLYKHDHPGVRDYLCNRMYTLPLSGIESYLFQICYMLVHKPSPSLDKFVIDICAKSLKIALKVQWFLMAELEDSDDNDGIGRIQEKCQTAATLMGEWAPLIKPQSETASSNVGKNQVLNRLLSSKQRLLSLATSPPPQKSFSFSPSVGNSLQEEGSSKASPDDSTLFKKFIPSPKVRNALMFRKSVDKEDEEPDKDGFFKRLLRDGKDDDEQDKDGFFKRLLRDGKDDDEQDKDGFFKRLLRDSKDEDVRKSVEKDDEDKEKDGFFRRLLKDSKDEDEVTSSSDNKFFKRLFRDSKGDLEEKSVSKSVDGDDKDGFFKKLFRDKGEEEEKVTNSAEDDDKEGFFRKIFKDKFEDKKDEATNEEGKEHANGVEEESSDFPLFRKLFRLQSDDTKTVPANEIVNGGGPESSPGTEIFFRKLFRDRDRSVEDSELFGSKKNKEKQRNENSSLKPPLPNSTASQFRKGTYHESLDFVHSLCETSYGLVDVFPVEDRKSALCESLTEINVHVAAAQSSGGIRVRLGKRNMVVGGDAEGWISWMMRWGEGGNYWDCKSWRPSLMSPTIRTVTARLGGPYHVIQLDVARAVQFQTSFEKSGTIDLSRNKSSTDKREGECFARCALFR